MPGIVSVDIAALREFARDYDRKLPAEVRRQVEAAIVRAGRKIVNAVVAKTDLRLNTRGDLYKDLKNRSRLTPIRVTRDILVLDVFPRKVKYSFIQEFGGVIRGKPYLRVPFPGVSERKIRANYGKLFPLRSKKGNLILAKRIRRSRGGFEPIILLKEKIKIKPRLRFRNTLRLVARRLIRAEMDIAVRRIFRVRARR